MAEPTIHFYEHKDLVAALVKDKGIHEGLWALTVQFGLGAVNVNQPGDTQDINPAAIVPVLRLGIRSTDSMSGLTVDAAEVNPAVGQTKAKKKPSSKTIKA